MRLIILTSSIEGTASHHLPQLIGKAGIDEILVVCSEGHISNKWRHYKRKLSKLFKIGLRGTLNGIRMRAWYGEGVKQHTTIGNLERICHEHSITLIKVPRINGPECRQAFTAFKPTLGLSLGNGYIGSKIFNTPSKGMLNIHHEILPDYQNAQSVIWQLYNGSASTGYTIHKIDKGIDTGGIVHQEIVPIQFEETLEETVSKTVAKLYDSSAEGLLSVIMDIDAKLNAARSQGAGGHYTTPSGAQMNRIEENFKKLKAQQS